MTQLESQLDFMLKMRPLFFGTRPCCGKGELAAEYWLSRAQTDQQPSSVAALCVRFVLFARDNSHKNEQE